MRTLLSRSIRPRVGHLSSNSTRSIPSATRRAFGSPYRRKLSFNDAFALLLAPILGTALIADTTWKDKKQREWNKKIAQVLDDLAQVQEKELQAWHRAQVRSIHNGVVQQRRSYSSHARQSRNDNDRLGSNHDKADEDRRIVRFCGGGKTAVPESGRQAEQSMTISDIYEGLVASRLAIEMLLYLRNKQMAYDHTKDVLCFQTSSLPQHADDLFTQLHDTEDKIRKLRGCVPPRNLTMDNEMDNAQKDLNRYIGNISQSYKIGKIDTASLVQGYAEAVMRSRRHLSLPAYGKFLEALSMRSQGVELPDIVLKAMRASTQLLGTRALWAMIWQYGKARNSGKLEFFLSMLTTSRSGSTLIHPWEHVTVGRTPVAVPVDRNSSLLNILVKVALQCHMLQKAEAWATLLCQPDVHPTRFSFIFRSFLSYCSDVNDWYLGCQWIQRAVMWASFLEQEGSDALPRTIYRMLDLCVACGQKEAYEEIMEAATMAGIEPHTLDKERAVSVRLRGRSIRKDWSRRLQLASREVDLRKHSRASSIRYFQERLSQKFPELTPFVGVTDQKELRGLMAEFDAAHDSKIVSSITLCPQKIFSTMGSMPLSPSLAIERSEDSIMENSPRSQTPRPLTPKKHHLTHLHSLTDQQTMLQKIAKLQERTDALTREILQFHMTRQQSTSVAKGAEESRDTTLTKLAPLVEREERIEQPQPRKVAEQAGSSIHQTRPSEVTPSAFDRTRKAPPRRPRRAAVERRAIMSSSTIPHNDTSVLLDKGRHLHKETLPVHTLYSRASM